MVKKKLTQNNLVPAIPIGAPTTLTEEIIQTPPLVAGRTIKMLSMYSKVAICLLNFLLHDVFLLISWLK